MYSDDQLKNLLDENASKYLASKHRGGKNNQKGNTYENHFAIYKIAILANELINEKELIDKTEIKIHSQERAFVDDLIIDRGANSELEHFQIKEVQALTWGEDNSKVQIAYDFRMQYELNSKALNRSSKLSLVLSNDIVANKLIADIPSDIQAYSSVFIFPYRQTVKELLVASNELKEAISFLTAFEKPTQDKIECVASILLGAWVSSDTSQTTVLGILQIAKTFQPCFIRALQSDETFALNPSVNDIFQRINGFRYSISRGFLQWKYELGGVVFNDGTYAFSLDSDDFQKLESRIMAINPHNFEDLENLL